LGSIEHFIWALGSLCALQRVPFSSQLLAQQFPPPYDRDRLISAAERLGLDAWPLTIDEACALGATCSDPERAHHFIARRRASPTTQREPRCDWLSRSC
jgi:hypothetical protein